MTAAPSLLSLTPGAGQGSACSEPVPGWPKMRPSLCQAHARNNLRIRPGWISYPKPSPAESSLSLGWLVLSQPRPEASLLAQLHPHLSAVTPKQAYR